MNNSCCKSSEMVREFYGGRGGLASSDSITDFARNVKSRTLRQKISPEAICEEAPWWVAASFPWEALEHPFDLHPMGAQMSTLERVPPRSIHRPKPRRSKAREVFPLRIFTSWPRCW